MEHFYFKSIDSRTMGIVERMPSFVRPEYDFDAIYIEGKDGAEIDLKSFAPYQDSFDFVVRDLSKLDEIMSWLHGKGQFIVSDDSDKFRSIVIVSELIYERKTKVAKKLNVPFLVLDPFRYSLNENNIVLTESGTATNQGTYKSNPVLTIVGAGEAVIDIDGRSFTYDFLTDTEVIIDSTKKDAYHPTLESLKNRQMTGEFPYLTSGVNNISWTGTVTSITIQPNSRWL